MPGLAELLAHTYPHLGRLLVPLAERWACAACASVDVVAFGILETTRFSTGRFGGRRWIGYFLCAGHRLLARLEIEDAIARGLEEEPAARGFTVFLGSRPRPRLV